jgi:acetyltransferase-like isoleucine patch superfamily enzyme
VINPLANIVGELEMGENCRIDAFVTITGKVKLGNNVHIGVGVSIFGTEGVVIGDDCSISPQASIFTGTFDAATGYRANPQIEDKQYRKGPVRIGNRCIVGAGSVVLPNVTLSDDVLVGALTLVKSNLAAGVYGGVPAVYLKAA